MSHDTPYICAVCREEFTEGWSEAEANAEAEANWGVSDASRNPHMACVCDDCYQEMVKAIPPKDWRA